MDLKSLRILVTPTSFGKHDPSLKDELANAVGEVIYNPYMRPLNSDELRTLLPGIDGYIAGLDMIDRAALEAADRLRVIARYGVGVDKVDVAAAREKGIQVTNTPGANAAAVAELVISLMLALARDLPRAVAETRRGGWPRVQGVALEGKCVGLLGFGAVGKAVARRLQGFDCRVMAYDPEPDAVAAATLGVLLVEADIVIGHADFLSLHTPLTPQTRGMVDGTFLRRMKRDSFLINTARGELIDEVALAEVLQQGQLAGAALDAFALEPPDPESALLKLDSVLVTPHMGAHTDVAIRTMGRSALEDCLAVLRGEQPHHPVTD